MAVEADGVAVKDAMVFLFAAGIIVPVLKWGRVPAVLGFVFAGIALGPFGLGRLSEDVGWLDFFTMTDPAAAAPFAELGVLFLLFLLGLELSFEKLWALRRVVFGAGLVQALGCAGVIGLVAWSLGLDPIAATIVGLALSLSSTAIVMQLLIDKKRVATPVGQTALGVLLMQDVLVAPILIFVGFAVAESSGPLLPIIGQAFIQGVAAVAIIVLIGRYGLARVFRLAATTGGRDFLMAITLFTIVGASLLTYMSGLSLALGAFMAGLLLGETEFRHQTEIDLEPFKGLLLGLFFMTVGMGLDIFAIWQVWPQVLGGLVLMIVIKTAITFIASRIFTGSTPLSIKASFMLAPAGEFAFVIMAAAATGGLFLPEQQTLISAIAGLSMILIPALSWLGEQIARGFEGKDSEHLKPSDLSGLRGHVVICGYGRVGEAIADILEAEDVDLVILERQATRASLGQRNGRTVFFGDASRPEILKLVGAAEAALFLVTLDDPSAVTSIVKTIRETRPNAPIMARANDTDHASDLKEAGASFVIPDAIEAGLQMAGRALSEFGYDSETVRDRLAAEREREYRRA
ncbi:MAG: cation:proton antiporter [Pseudomonadota bacterium]